VHNAMCVSTTCYRTISTSTIGKGILVAHRNILTSPLGKGIIPVVVPVGYATATQQASTLDADDVVLALARELAGIITNPPLDEEPLMASRKVKLLQGQISLDRLIILDPAGGIQSIDHANGTHIF